MTEPTNKTDSQTHEQQMVAAAAKVGVTVDGQPVAPPAPAPAAPAARPEHVPEKFWNADSGQINTDALLKSYSELEKKSSAPPAPAPAPASPAPAAASPTVAAVLKTATDEIATDGKVSEATKALMEKAGVDEATVNLHVEAIKTKAHALIAEVFKSTGGEENYRAMIQWAGTNLSPEEAQQFDTLVKGEGTALTAVKGLYARYRLDGGQDGKVRTGGPGAPGEDVFRSPAELTAAVSDPRYKNDTAYRKDVEAKMVRSSRNGSVRLAR